MITKHTKSAAPETVRISWEQLSDDALAALGDANLDELEFRLEEGWEVPMIYCANHDEHLAWFWDRDALEWRDFSWLRYRQSMV